jgi:hypothetical protein
MYIFELIAKLLSKVKKPPKEEIMPNFEVNPNLSNSSDESCDHNFMPLDSSNEILACTKCGILKKRSDLKNKNFFMRKEL